MQWLATTESRGSTKSPGCRCSCPDKGGDALRTLGRVAGNEAKMYAPSRKFGRYGGFDIPIRTGYPCNFPFKLSSIFQSGHVLGDHAFAIGRYNRNTPTMP